MKIDFVDTPWFKGPAPEEAIMASNLLEGVWRESATEFVAIRENRLQQGLREPKGFQSLLNRNIDLRFQNAGWDGEGGRFRLDKAWLRITFRHQMSLGSDFLDALRVIRNEGVDFTAICAAPLEILKVVSPNDATVLTSFEKIKLQAASLNGVFDFPMMIGALVPHSGISPEVLEKLLSPRPRN